MHFIADENIRNCSFGALFRGRRYPVSAGVRACTLARNFARDPARDRGGGGGGRYRLNTEQQPGTH